MKVCRPIASLFPESKTGVRLIITGNLKGTRNEQFIVLVATNDEIHAIGKWSISFGNALPCISTHNDCIQLSIGRRRGCLSKVLHFFREAPWKS